MKITNQIPNLCKSINSFFKLVGLIFLFQVIGCQSPNSNHRSPNNDPILPYIAAKYWISPMPYKNGQLENLDPEFEFVRGALIRDQFRDIFTQPEKWQSVKQQTKIFKLYIGVLYPSSYPKYPNFGTSDEDLKAMIQFFKATGIQVAFEVGGIRPPFSDCNNLFEKTFSDEIRHLDRWISLGGNIDYLVFDHPIGFTLQDQKWNLLSGKPIPQANKCHNNFDFIVSQTVTAMAHYYQYFKKTQQQLQLGLIESLGYYTFPGVDKNSKQFIYETTAKDRYPRFYFSKFIEVLNKEMAANKITLSHYGLDFNDALVNEAKQYPQSKYILRGQGEKARDYGRLISAKFILNQNNIPVGYIANSFAKDGKEAELKTLLYYKEFKKFVIAFDEEILQFWHQVPDQDLPESKPGTSFNIFKKIMGLK